MKPDAEEDSLKRLALIMAVACVRNTCIEEFHARPQPQFLSDADMKRFNQEVADKLYTFLHYLIRADQQRGCGSWRSWSRFCHTTGTRRRCTPAWLQPSRGRFGRRQTWSG